MPAGCCISSRLLELREEGIEWKLETKRNFNGRITNTIRALSKDFLSIKSSEPRYSSTRKWRALALDNVLWCNLFKERWGDAHANFYAPTDSKTWKDVYEVQDRCDRVGLGLKIVREGDDYFLIHLGEIQRHLGSRNGREFVNAQSKFKRIFEEGSLEEEQPDLSILDKIFFFSGDLEVALSDAKRTRFS